MVKVHDEDDWIYGQLPVRLRAGTQNIGDVDVVSIAGVLSTGNSTTTPLAADATFTGATEEILNYATIRVMVFTDQDSAAEGLKVQYSTDGVNWDHQHTFTIAANISAHMCVHAEARYFRIQYVNGGDAQSVFRLQVIYNYVSLGRKGYAIIETIKDDESCALVRAVLSAKKPTADYVNIESTTAGNLKIAVEEFDTSLPAGTNNIGDVDVLTTVPPDIDSYEVEEGTSTADGSGTGTVTFSSAVNAIKVYNLTNTDDIQIQVGTGDWFRLLQGERWISLVIPANIQVKVKHTTKAQAFEVLGSRW